jgi:hypothetical protein
MLLFLDTLSLNDSLYTTAIHDTNVYNNGDIKTTDDNFSEDNNSIIKENLLTSKRKRIRKKKKKKLLEVVPDSDTSSMRYSSKKPKIIDSVLISSGKHIRFKGLEDEDTISDNNPVYENGIHGKHINNDFTNKQLINKDLNTLLNLRQSSTPLTFGYKKIKKEIKPEVIDEDSKSMNESQRSKENSQLNETIQHDDTVSFKVHSESNF